jgi:hypothetical protein
MKNPSQGRSGEARLARTGDHEVDRDGGQARTKMDIANTTTVGPLSATKLGFQSQVRVISGSEKPYCENYLWPKDVSLIGVEFGGKVLPCIT